MNVKIIFTAIYRTAIIMLLWVIAGAVSTNDSQVLIGIGSIFVALISIWMIAVFTEVK